MQFIRERERECVCVCVCVRERERERERESVCVCVCVREGIRAQLTLIADDVRQSCALDCAVDLLQHAAVLLAKKDANLSNKAVS